MYVAWCKKTWPRPRWRSLHRGRRQALTTLHLEPIFNQQHQCQSLSTWTSIFPFNSLIPLVDYFVKQFTWNSFSTNKFNANHCLLGRLLFPFNSIIPVVDSSSNTSPGSHFQNTTSIMPSLSTWTFTFPSNLTCVSRYLVKLYLQKRILLTGTLHRKAMTII